MTRLRTQSYPSSGGGTRQRSFNANYFNNDVQAPFTVLTNTCEDSTGKGSDHPCYITHMIKNGVTPLTGSIGVVGMPGWFTWYYGYNSWYPDFLVSQTLGHLPNTLPSVGAMATTVLAKSNPSKPYVSLPNFLYELKDLPGMIRDIGHIKHQLGGLVKGPSRSGSALSARDLANHQLAAQMGWDPLISDLRKMLDFQSQVDRRIVDLENLFVKNEGLHRTVGKSRPPTAKGGGRSGMWTQVLNSSSTVTVESALGIPIQCRLDQQTTVECWGSTRWTSVARPGTDFSSKKLAQMARLLVFGLNINTKAVWDAFPWTWLIDWFTNVGDYLEANTNVIPVVSSTPCIMTHEKTVTTWTRIDGYQNDIAGATGSTVYESKARTIAVPTISATIPFLSGRQLSILGALAVQRFR